MGIYDPKKPTVVITSDTSELSRLLATKLFESSCNVVGVADSISDADAIIVNDLQGVANTPVNYFITIFTNVDDANIDEILTRLASISHAASAKNAKAIFIIPVTSSKIVKEKLRSVFDEKFFSNESQMVFCVGENIKDVAKEKSIAVSDGLVTFRDDQMVANIITRSLFSFSEGQKFIITSRDISTNYIKEYIPDLIVRDAEKIFNNFDNRYEIEVDFSMLPKPSPLKSKDEYSVVVENKVDTPTQVNSVVQSIPFVSGYDSSSVLLPKDGNVEVDTVVETVDMTPHVDDEMRMEEMPSKRKTELYKNSIKKRMDTIYSRTTHLSLPRNIRFDTSKKHAAVVATFALLLLMVPSLLFAGGLGMARLGLRAVNSDAAINRFLISEKLFANSRYLSGGVSNIFLVGKPFAVIHSSSEIAIRAVSLAVSIHNVENDVDSLVNKIASDEYVNIDEYADKLSVSLGKIYHDSGFLKGDVSGGGKITSIVLNAILGDSDISSRVESIYLYKRLASELPEIFGSDETKTYAVVLQDNNNLKPTGGALESVAFMNIAGGRLIDIQVISVRELDENLSGFVKPPQVLGTFYPSDETWKLDSANWDSHFPKSAENIIWFLDKETDLELSGVVAIDRSFLSDSLEVVGELSIDGVTVNSENVDRVLREKDERYRELLLSNVIRELYEVGDSETITSLISGALSDRSMMLYFLDGSAQRTVYDLGWSGRKDGNVCVENCHTDYIEITEANTDDGNVGEFIERDVVTQIEIDEDSVSHLMYLTLKNNHSSDSYKAFVQIAASGESKYDFVKALDEKGKVVSEFLPDTRKRGDLKEASVLVAVDSGKEKTVVFGWETPSEIDLRNQGRYILNIPKQPGVIELPAKIFVKVPAGIAIKSDPEFSLTQGASYGYNTLMLTDFESEISW